MATEITLSLPSELADDLSLEESAGAQSAHRTSSWELAISAASTTSVMVTLLQTPEMVKKLAEACERLVKRADKREPPQSLEAHGPGGDLRIRVTDNTDLRQLERFLKDTIFTDLDQPDSLSQE